jgi:ribosomal protein L37AE/L43A
MGINLWGVGEVDSGKFAVRIDYLAADIEFAVTTGRDACVAAAYCPACGYAQFEASTWYCRNCGKPYAQKAA